MKSATAVAVTLAGAVWLSCAYAQSPVGRHVDAARDRIWSLTKDGVSLHDTAGTRRAAVVLPGWHWAGTPYGSDPALALGPQGEAIVTSDIAPVLWRIDPATLAVSVHALTLDADAGKDVGFSALAYSREHDAFVGISGMHGSVWMIDRPLTRARKIKF